MPGTSRSGRNEKTAVDRTPDDGGPDRPPMTEAEEAKWDELMTQIPETILRKADVHLLLNLCRLLVMADTYSSALRGDPLDHKTGRMYHNTMAQIGKLSASYGLTPYDRKRLNIDTKEEVDALEDFMNS